VGNGCKRLCVVCGRGIGNNSIQCTRCQKWVHRKCTGINGIMYKVMKTFVCRGCMNPVTGTRRTSIDIGDIISVLQQNRLRWYGHLLRKEDKDWVKLRVPGQEVDQ